MQKSTKAKVWQKYYALKSQLVEFQAIKHYSLMLNIFIISLCFSAALFVLYSFESVFKSFFFQREVFIQFKSILLGIGSSLIGAASIAFTFLIFSLQNNLDKLPYGLLRKSGVDTKLIIYYLTTLLLAISICLLSLYPDYRSIMTMLSLSFISITSILIMFILAYKRTLLIVNPAFHIDSIILRVSKNNKMWGKAFERSKALIEDTEENIEFDNKKLTYLALFPNWSKPTLDAIKHCILLAKTYRTKGDVEVSQRALSSIVHINIDYIKMKGKTFFTLEPFIDNPLSSDPIISYTLEEIRQNINVGITENDEQFVIQNVRLLHDLARVYYKIDYSSERATKWHAHLTTGYLTSAIEEQCIPNNLVEVTLESIRLLGNLAQIELSSGDLDSINTLSKKISLYASIGAVNNKYQCVSQVGIEQLSKLMFQVIISKNQNIQLVSQELSRNITQVAKLYIQLPEIQFSNFKSQCLGEYFSATSQTSFLQSLTRLVNHICSQDDEPNQEITDLIFNVTLWASESYSDMKDIFIESVKNKSSVSCDVINWLEYVIKYLLAISQSPHARDYDKDELLKLANWYTQIFSWIPNENEPVQSAESYGLTDSVFSVVQEAYNHGLWELVFELKPLLLSWGKKACAKGRGWRTLEQTVVGYIIIDMLQEIKPEITATSILKLFNGVDALDDVKKESLNKYLKEKLEDHHGRNHPRSRIEYSMSKVDQTNIKERLNIVIEHLTG